MKWEDPQNKAPPSSLKAGDVFETFPDHCGGTIWRLTNKDEPERDAMGRWPMQPTISWLSADVTISGGDPKDAIKWQINNH